MAASILGAAAVLVTEQANRRDMFEALRRAHQMVGIFPGQEGAGRCLNDFGSDAATDHVPLLAEMR